ncbi:RdRP-domain-containing protein [Hypoxylon cercidicola]|nr:RdRP-domain-containing protein [Hypoxylon cercidicola]
MADLRSLDGLEVFMNNLPPDFTDQGLKAQLSPFITDRLGFTDWECQKFRGRKYGSITFLYRTQGERFLLVYGEESVLGFNRNGKPRTRARLTFLNHNIFCRRSDRSPDPYLLRSLLDAAEDLQQDEDIPRETANDKTVDFKLDSLSCGHYEYPHGKFAYTPDITWPVEERVANSAKFARDTLIINFTSRTSSIRVEIPYRTIHEIIVAGRPTSLTLTLEEAPRFFEVFNQDPVSLMSRLGIYGSMKNVARVRLNYLPHDSANHADILGQSLVYRIQVSPNDFQSKFQRLKEKERLIVSYYDFPDTLFGRTSMADGLKAFRRLVDECGKTSIVPFDVLFQLQALVHNGYLLPQTVEALLIRLCKTANTSSINGSSSSTANRARGLAGNGHDSDVKQAASSFPFSAGAFKKLFSQIFFPGPDIEASTFGLDEIWSYLEDNEKEIRCGLAKELISERGRQNLIMVYKVQVTPSRFILSGPEPEAKNRILRRFPHHTGYFVRVQFCEEDGQDLFFNARVSLDVIWKRFKTFLLQGVHIAGRGYKFLGFSHSSLRAHSVWFMAEFEDHNGSKQTYSSVISHLGKFNKIFSPPRCAARIGQAFSETPFSIDLQELGVTIERIDDVESRDGNRVFSDGVGTLSRSLMEAIHDALPQTKGIATCFQIRWGGAKGMLALDDTLDGMVMRVRRSMLKFESDDIRNLEICDMGNKPIPLVLNRQMIKILEDMGVKESWFFDTQNRELTRLRMIAAYVRNTVEFLKRQKVAEQINFSRFIRRLHKIGIDYKKDAFLCSVVETVILREVRLLKHKARIPIEKGITLFGIMDEFGFLEEDEVYVTFEKNRFTRSSDLDICDKLVIVTRSPALHPGDIQVRRAVLPPPYHPLRSLKNCIVFSQKGQRDLPSQLSGGDLDGDISNTTCLMQLDNIIWDDDAVSSSRREFEPADYPRVSPLDIGREVTMEDMTGFFVDFMATDQLGVIAVKHMILADMKDGGTVDPECKLLAEMHSTGVDYSKSGIPIDTEKLRGLTRTQFRPDFLAPAPPANIVDRTEIVFEAPKAPALEDEDEESGPKYKFYKSIKVLGKLYRAIDEKKIWKENIHRTERSQGTAVWDQLFRYITIQCEKLGDVNWRPNLDEARRIRQTYDDAIWSATMDNSDHSTKGITELEVFTGCIFNKSGVQTKRQRDRSVRLKDDFDRIAKVFESSIRKKKIEPREDDGADDNDSDAGDYADADVDDFSPDLSALELSIACLHVGTSTSNKFGRNNSDFQSFKVIAAQCVLSELEIALMNHQVAMGEALRAASAK